MYNYTYNLGAMMTFTIVMGMVMIWLFSTFAKRDSEGWDKTFERKGMKITRIILMCIWGIYVVAPLIMLIFGWDKIRDNQKVSYVSYIMLGLSLLYYELTFHQSPRSIWVKIRKVFAYILIGALYIAVLPTTLLQLTTGKVAGVYGNAIGTILFSNTLIYGISILIIWLLLKQYKRDKYVPYTKKEIAKNIETSESLSIEKNIQQNKILQDNHVTIATSTEIPPKQKPNLKQTRQVDGYLHRYLIYYAILVVVYLVFSSMGPIQGWYTGIMSIIGILIFPSLLPIGLYNLISNMFDGRMNSGDNKKRLLAYYLIYEIILIVLTIVLLIISEPEDEPDTKGFFILMAIMALLSFLPIGITYIKQLLSENTVEQVDSVVHTEAPKKEKRKIQFNKKTLKWILTCALSILVIIGGIPLYNYLHDEYIPKRKLKKVESEIIKKFNNEETRTEYAINILKKDFDWGYDEVYHNGNDIISINLEDYRKEAFSVIEEKAYQGDAKCQNVLGRIYLCGAEEYYVWTNEGYNRTFVNRSEERAAYWFLESAQNGYIHAFNNIGNCYMLGIGVSRDFTKGVYWLKIGAEAGDDYAQLHYGDLFVVYKLGEGYSYTLRYDVEEAKYWWKKAAAQGNEMAKERLQKIYN